MKERARPVRGRVVLLAGGVAVAVALFSWACPLLRLQAASIVGSFHDLAHIDEHHVADMFAGRVYNDYNEVCVYCHTPHHASTVQQPLWNRQNYTVNYQTYFSETMETVPGQPGPTSRLCLSCHDGTIAVDAVINVPNAAYVELSVKHGRMLPYNDPNTWMENCSDCHIDLGWGWPDFRYSFLGTNLANDHPIAIPYLGGSGLAPIPEGGVFPNGVRLVDGQIECVTCHNVHDPAIKPFLRAENSQSALCLTCHVK